MPRVEHEPPLVDKTLHIHYGSGMSYDINEIRVAPSYMSDRDAAIYVNLPRPDLVLALSWEQVPELITKLRRAYNEHVANTPTP
jgi:hypothetical protein